MHSQLSARSIWLRGADEQAYFPTNERFSLPGTASTLHVEGSTVDLAPTAAGSSPISLSAPVETEPGPSTIPRATRSNKGTFFSLKIVKATLSSNNSNKPEFTPLEVAYVQISSGTANIQYINDEVQRKWGSNFILVSNDGLPIVDTQGTRG